MYISTNHESNRGIHTANELDNGKRKPLQDVARKDETYANTICLVARDIRERDIINNSFILKSSTEISYK